MNINKMCILLFMTAIMGCEISLENASWNMKKGDSFYASKEYDVAEYYYGKIPEESPLYKQAKNKIDSIAIIRKYWAITIVTPEDMVKIAIMDHSAKMNVSTMNPLHSFVIVNGTLRTLSMISVECTYFDANGTEIERLVCDLKASVPSMKKGVFGRVEPGTLKVSFARSTIKLVGAKY